MYSLFRLLACLALLLVPMGGIAADAPPAPDSPAHLEIGIGIGGAHFPDYPGASRDWNILLPWPYFTFETPHLKAGRDGVLGRLLHGGRWSLNVDFSGSVPVRSSRDPERHGMPNLGWIVQSGPVFNYRLWDDRARGYRLTFALPVRAAASGHGLVLHHRGWVTQPALTLTRRWNMAGRHFHADIGLSRLYASQAYFDYIYGVAPAYADFDRPAWQAGGGGGAWRLALGFGWRKGALRWGAFVNYTDLSAASFRTSPLVSETRQLSYGFAVAWALWHVDEASP